MSRIINVDLHVPISIHVHSRATTTNHTAFSCGWVTHPLAQPHIDDRHLRSGREQRAPHRARGRRLRLPEPHTVARFQCAGPGHTANARWSWPHLCALPSTSARRPSCSRNMPRTSSAQPSSSSLCASSAAAAERRRLPYAHPEAAGATDARGLDVEEHTEQPCAHAIHRRHGSGRTIDEWSGCLLYTSDAADE